MFPPFHSELELWNTCMSACICICFPLCSSSCTFMCDNWKWSQTKSMVITTSSNLECNYTVDADTLSGHVAQKQIHQALLWMKLDWLIDLCMSSEGQRERQKETTECESGSGEGSNRFLYGWSTAPWWGKESIESDRDKWSVRDREKEIQTYACWPQPFFSPTNQYREMHVCVWVCVLIWREGGSVSLPIKIRETVTLPLSCLTPPWPSNLCTCLYLILYLVIL